MKNIFEDKRVVTKILKVDENNQYGNAKTKPLPMGSIKRVKILPTMKEFDLILQGISDEDKIGHLFIVELNLIRKMPAKSSCFLTKFTRQFLKKKVLSANERSAFQLLDAMMLNDKSTMNSYKTTAKTHATMVKKIAIPFYAEHLHLLISSVGGELQKLGDTIPLNKANLRKNLQL